MIVFELHGAAIGRMVETMKMLLAIHKASLPISIYDPEGVRKRLLGQDNIGIVPHYSTLHRANQHFKKEEDVYDVLYYDDLGRFKRRITTFIRWEPLPILNAIFESINSKTIIRPFTSFFPHLSLTIV